MSQILGKQQTQEDSNDADPINKNIQTIVELHKRAENEVSKQQRTIENITNFLGRPTFLFIILVFVSLWIIVNTLLIKFGFSSFDPPPFIWLQGILSLGALLQATMILITKYSSPYSIFMMLKMPAVKVSHAKNMFSPSLQAYQASFQSQGKSIACYNARKQLSEILVVNF